MPNFLTRWAFLSEVTPLSPKQKRKSTFENYDKRFINSCLPKESESLNSFINRSCNVLCNKFNISKKKGENFLHESCPIMSNLTFHPSDKTTDSLLCTM